jgi:hypothetical protein
VQRARGRGDGGGATNLRIGGKYNFWPGEILLFGRGNKKPPPPCWVWDPTPAARFPPRSATTPTPAFGPRREHICLKVGALTPWRGAHVKKVCVDVKAKKGGSCQSNFPPRAPTHPPRDPRQHPRHNSAHAEITPVSRRASCVRTAGPASKKYASTLTRLARTFFPNTENGKFY